MNDQAKDREIQRKREYHRKWRAEHQDSVKAAQARYWLKKAEELNLASRINGKRVEIRSDK